MKLYLVRHGQTPWNKQFKVQGHSDIPLNEEGRLMAKRTGQGMRNIHLDIAYTSPLSRARETAELILEGRDVLLLEDLRIKEIGFGEAEGVCCRWDEKHPQRGEFHKFFTQPDKYQVPSGGESIQELEERVGDFMQEICHNPKLKDKSVLVTTHGATLRAMLNLIKGITDKSRFWEGRVLANCSVTSVEVKEGKMKILEEGHLYYNGQP